MSQSSNDTQGVNDIIAALPLFKGVDPVLLRGMITSARMTEQDKGSLFLMQNQPISRFYILLDGWCAISKGNQNGQESILQILSQGDFLPEPDLSQAEVSPFNVQALTQVRLLMLPPSLVRSAMEHSPQFAKNMLFAIIRRTQELRDHIEQLTLRNAEERVGRFLLQMRPTKESNPCEIPLPFDKTMVASYLGIKPETLSRTLQLFKERGFEIQRHHVVAPSFASLCGFCDSTLADKCHHAHTEQCPNPDFKDAILGS